MGGCKRTRIKYSERNDRILDVIKKYGDFIKNTTPERPERARKLIRLGLKEEVLRHGLLPDKGMPKAYTRLNQLALKSVLSAWSIRKRPCESIFSLRWSFFSALA